ncbi:superoxide dismutase [Inquilinus sp. CAU 1745]|uniref:superoxide dismutase n=1 Tax=Inquilinus sp. CAU 1745 TaxID=3140369 RepID=UPI00325B909D
MIRTDTLAAISLPLNRRRFLGGLAAAAAVSAIRFPTPALAQNAGAIAQPPLPYDEAALEPVISGRTVGLHYGKHHAGYYETLNGLIEGTEMADMSLEEIIQATADDQESRKIFNNAGQAWNHEIYWEQMTPEGPTEPGGALAERIGAAFGGMDAFKEEFTTAAGDIFGSGWQWLIQDGDGVALMSTPGGDNPLAHGQTALLGIDVWEHAYYLDYENRRKEHVAAVLDNIVDWEIVAGRMTG